MKYMVYEHRPTNKASVHEDTCGHANRNGGLRRCTVNGQWHEGFETFEAALCKAKSTGRVVSCCSTCKPSISK